MQMDSLTPGGRGGINTLTRIKRKYGREVLARPDFHATELLLYELFDGGEEEIPATMSFRVLGSDYKPSWEQQYVEIIRRRVVRTVGGLRSYKDL